MNGAAGVQRGHPGPARLGYDAPVLADARASFNAAFSPDLHRRYLAALEGELGPVPFRIAETPLFLPPSLRDRLYRSAAEILALLPAAAARAPVGAVPPAWQVPGRDEAPGFALVDLAIVRNAEGELDGRVVELQGFASLSAFALIQARILRELLAPLPGLDRPWSALAPPFDESSALKLMRESALAGEDPEGVVLLEIQPRGQKTLPDFVAIQKLLGIEPVCVTEVIREGRRLFRRKAGRLVQIRRLYNRVVFDELAKKQPEMSFAFSDELEVSWYPHPSWQWAWSKLTLPYLDHPAVPRAHYLSELRETPADLSRWVLKPLFSFAGAGVKISPTAADLAAVPEAERGGWLLQEKIDYARELYTPEGHGVAAEVRVMCLRSPGMALPVPLVNLTRLSRGALLGVDHNRDFDWVGASVGLCAG